MGKRKHRTHAPEFKFKLVVEVLKGEKSRAEIARENDITRSLLHNWEQAFLTDGADIFRSTETKKEELEESRHRVADLERLAGTLALENEVLKKFETVQSSQWRKSGR